METNSLVPIIPESVKYRVRYLNRRMRLSSKSFSAHFQLYPCQSLLLALWNSLVTAKRIPLGPALYPNDPTPRLHIHIDDTVLMRSFSLFTLNSFNPKSGRKKVILIVCLYMVAKGIPAVVFRTIHQTGTQRI